MNKKILIVINNLGIGGAERLVVDETKEMLRFGVDVILVTLRPEPLKSFLAELRLGPEKFKKVEFKSLWDISAWFKLIRFIRQSKPSLIITQLWFANTVGRIAATIAGTRNIISFEQNIYDTVKTKKMFFVDWCLQFLSSKIIAVSQAVKKSLIRHSIHESRIDVLYNSIDQSKFSVSRRDPEVRKKYNIPEHAFLYIFVGRLIYQKAVDVLIEAFKKIEPDSYLLIVGQGKDRDSLENEAKKKALGGRVIFAGVQNDIPQLLSSSDCFVLPSRYEGLPLVLTEALAAGIAIIVSDFEAVSEIITHEKNGLIVSREDVHALVQAMGRIRNDNGLRLRLAHEAKRSAEFFSISSHARAILCYIKPNNI